MRLKRTQVSAPAYDINRIIQVLNTNTDMIMIDLEDNVIPPLKSKARKTIANAITSLDFRGIIKCFKINGWASGQTMLDLEAVLPLDIDEIKLSKCENAEDIHRLDKVISEFEKANGLSYGTIEINAQIESTIGIRNAYEIFSASPRVKTASFGYEDLASEYGIYRDYTPGTQQATYMEGKFVLDAKAAGVQQIIGTAIVAKPGDFQGKEDYVKRDSMRLKDMGFTGRGAVYFNHIDVINNVFTPNIKDIEMSKQIVDSWNEGMKTGNPDFFTLENGLPIDPGRLERARRIIRFGIAYEKLMLKRKGILSDGLNI